MGVWGGGGREREGTSIVRKRVVFYIYILVQSENMKNIKQIYKNIKIWKPPNSGYIVFSVIFHFEYKYSTIKSSQLENMFGHWKTEEKRFNKKNGPEYPDFPI